MEAGKLLTPSASMPGCSSPLTSTQLTSNSLELNSAVKLMSVAGAWPTFSTSTVRVTGEPMAALGKLTVDGVSRSSGV